MFKYKITNIIFFSFCLVGLLKAQQVPNYIGKDINGVEHNLYDYLDDGKVVIVEVFATWCSTCWDLHNTEKIERLYSTYGPDGMDQLVVLYIEGDIKTEDATLYGENSYGNWVDGVPYPIFNPSVLSNEFLEVFATEGFPTTNVICPATKEIIADVYQDDLSKIIDIIQLCGTISNVTDLQILGKDSLEARVCDTVEIEVDVLNSGTETIEQFELLAIAENGETLKSHNCIVSLDPGHSIEVNLGEYKLESPLEYQEMELEIKSLLDQVSTNNNQNITYRQAHEVQNEVHLEIKTDFWVESDNSRWWVENSSGEIVIPVHYLEVNQEIEESFYLENNDCFTFIIAEDYGDGIAFGSVKLYSENGTVLFDNAYFDSRGETSFEYIGSATTAEETLNEEYYALKLFPTLVSAELQVNLDIPISESIKSKIFNLQGLLIFEEEKELNQGANSWLYPTGNLPSGIYLLQIQTAKGILAKKFTKI